MPRTSKEQFRMKWNGAYSPMDSAATATARSKILREAAFDRWESRWALKKLSACGSGQRLVEKHKTIDAAWHACEEVNLMAWWLAKLERSDLDGGTIGRLYPDIRVAARMWRRITKRGGKVRDWRRLQCEILRSRVYVNGNRLGA